MIFSSPGPPLEKWKPGVPKSILLLIAGVIWVSVGILLNVRAAGWMKALTGSMGPFIGAGALLSGFLIHRFGFSGIVRKNIRRIIPLEGRRCLFSFFQWKSYLLMGIMILTGGIIRHSGAPRFLLILIYSGIGTAMILSGSLYFGALCRPVRETGF